MTLRTVTYDDTEWQLVPKVLPDSLLCQWLPVAYGNSHRVERIAATMADRLALQSQWRNILAALPEPPASMLTQQNLTRAINALGIDSRAGMPDYVLSDAIWAHLHGIPAKSLPAQPRRPYGTATLSEYGVIPECDGPKPSAQEPKKMTPAMWLGAWAAELANAPEPPPPAQEPTTPDRYQALRDALEQEHSVFQQWAFRSAADHATIAALLKERDALRAALRQIAEWPDGGNRYGQEKIKRFARDALADGEGE